MGRPFAVIGFTMFVTLFFLCALGQTAAIALLVLSVILSVLFAAIRPLRRQKVLLLAFLTCVFSSVLFLGHFHFVYVPATADFNQEALICGTVEDYPDYQYGAYYYEIKVDSINDVKPAQRFLIRLSQEEILELEPGDSVTFRGTLCDIGANSRFSKLNYLSKGIYARAKGVETVQIQKNTHRWKGFHSYLAHYRRMLIGSLKRYLPADNAALAAAISTGDKSYMRSDILEQISAVGISHIICVSGLHLSILGFAVITFLKHLHFSRKLRYAFAAGFVLAFMAFCGFGASVVRAGIMFLIYILAELILAEPDSRNSLGLAAIVILLNPFHAGNIGFIFSFVATLSIITCGVKITAYCKQKLAISQRGKIAKFFFTILEIGIISVCVNVFCLPFSIIIFHKIGFLGIIANIFVLPFASVLLQASALAAVLGLLPAAVFAPIVYPIAFVSSALCAYILNLVAWMSTLPFISIFAGEKSVFFITGIVLSAIGVFLLLQKHKAVHIATAAVLALSVPVSIASGAACTKSHCLITAHAVGYGMCIGICSGDEYILIDTGGDSYSYQKIANDLVSLNKDTIDYLVLTSFSGRESGNAERVLHRYKVNNLIYSFQDKAQYDVDAGTKVCTNEFYQTRLSSGLQLSFFHSDFSAVHCAFYGVGVLILNRDTLNIFELPAAMREFDYLIVKGNSKNVVVNYKINGIIEVNKNSPSVLPEEASESFFTTADNEDVLIRISKNKTTIGRANAWLP